ncbi:dialkylresorcinol condensing enzyme DarA [Bacteroidota bacterium]
MNKILILYYSQSGQLTEIVKNFAKPFENSDDYTVKYANIEPVKEYEFPWKGFEFFDAFPESVNRIPCELKPLDLEDEDFDLIVFAYTVWYMSPSIPSNSFLLSDQAKRIFNNKPVITLLGIRNMWILAQEYVKTKIIECGGNLIGNVVLRDRAENITGIVTISYFMFTGKKDRFLGFFPKPGISEKDIVESEKYGKIVKQSFEENQLDNLQDKLLENKAVKVNPYLLSVEKTAAERVFKLWANFILKKGGPGNPARRARVNLFRWYFPFAILVIAPLKYVFFLIFATFRIRKSRDEVKYFSHVKLKLNK